MSGQKDSSTRPVSAGWKANAPDKMHRLKLFESRSWCGRDSLAPWAPHF